MPTLHEPTFEVDTAPKALLTAVRCIGSLYGSAESRFSASRKFFEDGYHALEDYAYILLEAYGIYMCDDSLLSKAQNIHHALVGAIRDLQMTHDGHASRLETPNSPEVMPAMAENDAGTLQKRWLDFIQEESRKRCIYSIYLLDSQLSIACNLRPQISALEIKYDLPCADDLWSARTAAAWESTRTQHFRSFNEPDDHFASDEAKPSEGSLYGSTQDLLHAHSSGSRHPPPPPPSPTLRLLWYSPFAALVLVTQLQMTARELTHASCLLERPRAAATTQRSLSILTEAQHGQISQALRNIAELIPPRRRPTTTTTTTNNSSGTPTPTTAGSSSNNSNTFAPLWHAFWLTHHYTSITLSHPDALLVTGVVETTTLPAAIATAAHLARPRARRANRDVYEDRDVFRILRDLEGALGEIAGVAEEEVEGI
ncbi:hypothetical protein SLS58_002935 [Diplodia intermedia]|uniref:Xylanolytic transcriptional activator regulatory domain-containing protein n=1 Tax=Diplodia intermedia TaxID=856260 RepID=A0ABR3TYT8_9PEZI